MIAASAGGEFRWYWYQATDRKRHAYRGKARRADATGARSICDQSVEFATAPYSEFYPSCWDCWRLIKELRGDAWPSAVLRHKGSGDGTSARREPT